MGLLVSPFADIMGAMLYCGASGLPFVSMTLSTTASCSPYEKRGRFPTVRMNAQGEVLPRTDGSWTPRYGTPLC